MEKAIQALVQLIHGLAGADVDVVVLDGAPESLDHTQKLTSLVLSYLEHHMFMPPKLLPFFILLCSCISIPLSSAELNSSAEETNFTPPENLEELYEFYVRDIDLLRDYRPGKNSFVEGPDRQLGQYKKSAGDRSTLLDIEGRGSLRHIWTTMMHGKGEQILSFYFDGEDEPRIRGTFSELINRAQEEAKSPVPGFIGQKHAYNFFTPIAFEKSLRMEMETTAPTRLIFYQLDYRTEKQSFEALPPAPPNRGKLVRSSSKQTIPPGGTACLAKLSGPAVLRKWSFQTDTPLESHSDLDLYVTYDGISSTAVAATIADFFGPFRGVSFDTDPETGTRTCRLPMPFAESAQLRVRNRTPNPVVIDFEYSLEALPEWSGKRGYFHAKEQVTSPTTGYRQHQVLYLHGKGHWLGMALYNTGHDHGGGDFAIIDGEGSNPAFLHGINGEDYFTFAWFGRGAHHPFAVAHANTEGRSRLHFENPYPFEKSFSLYWGTYPDLATRSVAYWYQDSPEDTTVEDTTNPLNADWDCFGPVPIPLDEDYNSAVDFTKVLPTIEELDAGKSFECKLISETYRSGWMLQRSIGPMLDLTYLARHHTRITGEIELGGMGHAFLARRLIHSEENRATIIQFSHDDPIRVFVNGKEVYRDDSTHRGFSTNTFPVEFLAGDNEVVVQLTNYFNVNFNWAGFSWLDTGI